MDDFSHITEELEIVEEGLKFRFNTERCMAVNEKKVPKAEDFELFRVRRAYHFNKGNEDHIVLTIPEPECLVLINKRLKAMQQAKAQSDGPCDLQLGPATQVVAVKGLGCVVDDAMVQWVAAPDEDYGGADVEMEPSVGEIGANSAESGERSEQDGNLSAVKESCSSFSPVQLNSSKTAASTPKKLVIKRRKPRKSLKRKLGSSQAPGTNNDDMCSIERALVVALKNSEPCKINGVNRLHDVSPTKIPRSNINSDTEKTVTNKSDEQVRRECSVRLEDICGILNETYKNCLNSGTGEKQQAEASVRFVRHQEVELNSGEKPCEQKQQAEASVQSVEHEDTKLHSGEKPCEQSVAQKGTLIRDEENCNISNIGTKAHENVEKVAICSNIAEGNSALRRILEAPLKSSKFPQNGAPTTQNQVLHDNQCERFYKYANEKQLTKNFVTNELREDFTDGIYRKNTLIALNTALHSEIKDDKVHHHKLDFNKENFHCDPDINIKEEFNCFMEDHIFLQNEGASDFHSETIYDTNAVKSDFSQENCLDQTLEAFEGTCQKAPSKVLPSERTKVLEEASRIIPKSEESSGVEEISFASQNSYIQPQLTEEVCEVEIFIPYDDDDEAVDESGYGQEHSQMYGSDLEKDKMQDTETCRRSVNTSSVEEPSEDVHTCNNEVTDTSLSSSNENVESQGENQEQHTCDSSYSSEKTKIKETGAQDSSEGSVQEISCASSNFQSSEETPICNDEVAKMGASSSEDIHEMQENIESRKEAVCDSNKFKERGQRQAVGICAPSSENEHAVEENPEFIKKVSCNCDKNICDNCEKTSALVHSQMDARCFEDIEETVELFRKINLDCRKTELNYDNNEDTQTHLQIDTNSLEDGHELQANSEPSTKVACDSNDDKGVCVCEPTPMSTMPSEDAHQLQENHESQMEIAYNEKEVCNQNNCDKTVCARESPSVSTILSEDADQDFEPTVEVTSDGETVLGQNNCVPNEYKSACAGEPSSMPTISLEDARKSEENVEPPAKIACDGINVPEQSSCDVSQCKSVCGASPIPTIWSEEAHQLQEELEPPTETVWKEQSSDQPQENTKPLIEAPWSARNVLEQSSYNENRGESICEPCSTSTLSSEDAHRSQETFKPSVEAAWNARNILELNNGDNSVYEAPLTSTLQSQEKLEPPVEDKSVCETSPTSTISSQDTQQLQESFESPAWDAKSIHEQSSCDPNRDKSVCEASPTSTLSSENTQQSHESFKALVEAACNARNILELNNGDNSVCEASSTSTHQSQEKLEPPVEDKSVCKASPTSTFSSKDAQRLQETFASPVEAARDAKSIHEQHRCDGNGDKNVCEASPMSTLSSENQLQEEFESSTSWEARNIQEQSSCDADGGKSVCEASPASIHSLQENVEPPMEVPWNGSNIFERKDCVANGDDSDCLRELPPLPTISSEVAHQPHNEYKSPLEVAWDTKNSCDASGDKSVSETAPESTISVQEDVEAPMEVSWNGRNSDCLHELTPLSTISSEVPHQSQEKCKSPIGAAWDAKSSESVCEASPTSTISLELQRSSCDAKEDKSVCVHDPPPTSTIYSEDAHQSQENVKSAEEVVWDERKIHDQNARDGNNDQNACAIEHLQMDVSTSEDLHKLETLLEVACNERKVLEQNEGNDAISALELPAMDTNFSVDVKKPEGNVKVPIEVDLDKKNVQEQNDCEEDKSAGAFEFSLNNLQKCPKSPNKCTFNQSNHSGNKEILQMETSSSVDVSKLQENLKPRKQVYIDGSNKQECNCSPSYCTCNKDKSDCAVHLLQMDVSSPEGGKQEELEPPGKDALNETTTQQYSFTQSQEDHNELLPMDTRDKLQENLKPLEKVDLDANNMQQCNFSHSNCETDTSSSEDAKKLQDCNFECQSSCDYNKNASACALAISTSSEAKNEINRLHQEAMGLDEQNAFSVSNENPQDFFGFSHEESKTLLLNSILTNDFSASEDESDDLHKTRCAFSYDIFKFYKFSAKRITRIEEYLSYFCNKNYSSSKQHGFKEEQKFKKPQEEVLNGRNIKQSIDLPQKQTNTEENLDHDYVPKYNTTQDNSMLNCEQGTQTPGTEEPNEDFPDKSNSQEGRQVEEMEQLLKKLIQDHIKSFLSQEGIDEEMAADEEKSVVKASEEIKENEPDKSEKLPEIPPNPIASSKPTEVFEYIPELSNDSIISERQLETTHEGVAGKRSSDMPMDADDNDKKLFKCNQCTFKARKENHLKVHTRVHILPFWCNICPETFADAMALHYHAIARHGSYIKSRSGEKPFHISHGEKPSISEDDPSLASNVKLYKCGHCSYLTSYIHRLQNHKRVHEKEKLHECHQCSYITLREWKLKRHRNLHASKEEMHECEDCGFISLYQHDWELHQQLHSGKKLYQCDMCPFNTAHVGYFNAHRGFHLPSRVKKEEPDEPEGRLRCEECDYTTSEHLYLAKHGKKFGHHVASHPSQSQSRLVCSECNYVANSYIVLKQHLMTHIDLKPCRFKDAQLVCGECKKVCLTPKDLKLHMSEEHSSIA